MELSPELSELAGIHAGDGYLRYSGSRKELDISGGLDEIEYYDSHVIPIFNRVFNLNIAGRLFPSRGTYGFVVRNKIVLEAFKNLGFPSGNKSTIVQCPSAIKESNNMNILRSFARGYFDTDGSLTFDRKIHDTDFFKKTKNFYPRLMFNTVSKQLALDFIDILKRLKFNVTYSLKKPKKETENLKYAIQLVGIDNLQKWMNEIGIKNPSKYSRYLLWKKQGFCPPNTTYDQRLNILQGHLI